MVTWLNGIAPAKASSMFSFMSRIALTKGHQRYSGSPLAVAGDDWSMNVDMVVRSIPVVLPAFGGGDLSNHWTVPSGSERLNRRVSSSSTCPVWSYAKALAGGGSVVSRNFTIRLTSSIHRRFVAGNRKVSL